MYRIPTAQDHEGNRGPPTSTGDLVKAWETDRPGQVGRRSHTLQADTVPEEDESQLMLSAKSVLLGQITKNTQRGIESYVTVPQWQLSAPEKTARFNFESRLRSAATSTFNGITDGLFTDDPERLKTLAKEFPLVRSRNPWTISFSHRSASEGTATAKPDTVEDDQGAPTYNVYVHSNGPSEFNVGDSCVVGTTTGGDITTFRLVSKTSTAPHHNARHNDQVGNEEEERSSYQYFKFAREWEESRARLTDGLPQVHTEMAPEALELETLESAKSALLAQIGRETSLGLESYVTASSDTLTPTGMRDRSTLEQGIRSSTTVVFQKILSDLSTRRPRRLKDLAIEYPNGQKPWSISFSHRSASGETAAVSASAKSDAEEGDAPEKDTSTYNVYVHSNGPSEFNVGEDRVVGKTTKADISKFGLVSKMSAA